VHGYTALPPSSGMVYHTTLQQQQPARAGGPELFANQRIRLAAAGMYYLAVVAEDGAVETCGNGAVGRLGIGDEQPRRRLTRVPQALFAGSRVIMLACGGEHTMAVTAAGYAWTCGYNGSGMLGGETRQTGWGLRRWTPGSSGARGS
jgi:alpha-tubulin suppressor-like RCC1 family protein